MRTCVLRTKDKKARYTLVL